MPDLIITFTLAQSNRVAEAVGRRYLNLNRGATAAEVKAHLIDFLRGEVVNHEKVIESAKITIPPFDPT